MGEKNVHLIIAPPPMALRVISVVGVVMFRSLSFTVCNGVEREGLRVRVNKNRAVYAEVRAVDINRIIRIDEFVWLKVDISKIMSFE